MQMPSVEFHAVRIYPLHSAVTLADLQRAFSEHEKQVKRWHLSGFSMPDGVHHAWAIFRHLEDALSFRDRYDGMCDRDARHLMPDNEKLSDACSQLRVVYIE